jgi:PAS domain S-box-containing protein
MELLSFHNTIFKNKLIAENTGEIMLFFNEEGKITDYNLMAMKELGYQKELDQVTIQDIFKNSVRYEDNTLKILNGYGKSEEAIAYRKNQTCFPVDMTITIDSYDNRLLGLCIAKNITEHKELLRKIELLEADIEVLNRNRNEIAANVTHELRTPVNGILGLSNNLLDTPLLPNQIETINLIKRCCNNMDSIINDLLDYAKLSSQKMILEQREFCFRDFMNSVVHFNRPRIIEKNLNLIHSIADDIPDRMIGDEFRLAQILNNLISNAAKFTTIGSITLEVAKLAQTNQAVELFFMVIDTGIGISMEDKDKLFQSFTQVDGSITRRFGGTGLGLAISKQLVEVMGGTIDVDSEQGKGSTFSFSIRLDLPMLEQDAAELNEDIALNNLNYYKKLHEINPNGNAFREINNMKYINLLLKEAGSFIKEEAPKTLSKEEIYKNISPIIEKLAICIEMESWDKAEELAYYIKRLLPPELGDITRIVFRLLLAVRKENYDVSVTIINELKTILD